MQAPELARRAREEFRAWQKVEELRQLLELVEQEELRAVIEIGTFKGGTLKCWCELAEPDAILVSIDKRAGEFGGGYKRGHGQMMQDTFPREQQSLQLLYDSHDRSTLAEAQRLLGERPVDLLFIDGDHSYEGVKQDFEMYAPLVKSDGLIAFHDILEHTRAPEVRVLDFWEEIKHGYRHVEYVAEPSHWGGIGVLWQK